MLDIIRDVRFAVRTLARTPAFTILSILTLALGIGATTAVFSMVNGVLLHRLPYTNDARLLHVTQPGTQAPDVAFSPTEVTDYRARLRSAAAVSEYHSMPFQMYGHGEPQRVLTGVVSDNFFGMLGVKPLLGRLFLPGEEAIGAPNVLVLSYRFWREAFGGDPSIVGTVFTMNDRTATVIGVLPPLPVYPDDNDIWMPAGACPFRSAPGTMSNRGARMLNLYVAAKPGVAMETAKRELAGVNAQLHQEFAAAYPADAKLSIEAVPVREELTRTARPLFLTLLASALFVLVVASANFANLTLSRQIRRSREFALRTALGAARARLFRQLATESLVVTVTGGALGVLLAFGGLGVLRAFATTVSPRAQEIAINPAVLAVALLLSVAVGLLAALFPLMRRQRVALADELRAAAAATTGARTDSRARGALVIAQVAVAFVILTGAGLLLRSLMRLQSVDGGYDARNVLTARVDLNWSRYTTPAIRRTFAEELMARLATQAGVTAVAVSSDFPLNSGQPSSQPFQIRGRGDVTGQIAPRSDVTVVSPDYFKAIGVPLLRGRVFANTDRDSAGNVALVSRRLADVHWAGRNPVGDQVSLNNGRTWLSIVGVVGDVRQNGPAQDISDEIYVPQAVFASRDLRVIIRTSGNAGGIASALRSAVRALDDKQPIVEVQTLDELRGTRLAEPRVTTALMIAFAMVALVITIGGLAGVVAYAVTQRVGEIGIRMALGADASSVLWLVLRSGVGVVVMGLVLGAAAALGITQLIRGLLFTVTPTDPLTFAAVALGLLGVGVLACWLPARRAMRVDPVEALRAR